MQLLIHILLNKTLRLESLSPSTCLAVMVQFIRTRYTVNEVAGSVEVYVQISSASEIVRVTVSTADGTALGKE